jgi:hypothetical protein
MKALRQAASLAAALLLLVAPPKARAESLWDMEGIGRPLQGYDLAARAAGGTAIGVIDAYQMSFPNPATIAWVASPQATFGYVQEDRWIQVRDSGASTQRRGSGRLTAARAALPIWGGFRFGIGYRDLTDGSYYVKFPLGGSPRTLTGAGGVGDLSLSLARSLWQDRVALGAQFGWAQGTLTDKIADAYNVIGVVNTSDLLRTRVDDGRLYAFGAQLHPVRPLVLGAFVQGANQFDVRGLWTTTSGDRLEERARLDYPSSYGLGGSLTLGRNRVSVDWMSEGWSHAGFHLQPGASFPVRVSSGLGPTADALHLGVGYTRLTGEVTDKDPLLRRTIWSAGFSWGRLPMEQALPNGAVQVHEVALTGGIGLPIQFDRGYVNGLLEIGRTGNLSDVRLRETFVRLGLGVTFGRFRSRF